MVRAEDAPLSSDELELHAVPHQPTESSRAEIKSALDDLRSQEMLGSLIGYLQDGPDHELSFDHTREVIDRLIYREYQKRNGQA